MADSSSYEKRILVAVCGSEKKHQQSFDVLRRHVEEKQSIGETPTSSGTRFTFMTLRYDSKKECMSTTPNATPDVILQKVSTLPPNAAVALQRWCAEATERRREERKSPIVLMDPLESTRLVLRRSFLCKLIERRLHFPLCATPRSWLYAVEDGPAMPLGISSFVLLDAADDAAPRASGQRGERWWIAKPDLSTGPAYTHHMVVWQGDALETGLPNDVRRLLPTEADAFVLQEFLPYSLPVVLKVYCIGVHLWVKTVSMTAVFRHIAVETGGRRNVPVLLDSQKIENDDNWKDAMHWEKFLSHDGRAYETIAHIAEELADELNLTLFGFDMVLVPQPLAPNTGGVGIAPSILPQLSEPPSKEMSIPDETPLFDENGVPTQRLCYAMPVVVDVNYFPGFRGMTNANVHLLEVIEASVEGGLAKVRRFSERKVNSANCCC